MSDTHSIRSDELNMPPSPTGTRKLFIPEHPHLKALNDAISSKALPCSSGVFPVHPTDLVLYYGVEGPNTEGLGRIDFTSHTDEQVQRLAHSCDVATFGRGHEDVHDESYRKAGKLDKGHFASTFDPERCGLMHAIRHNILEGHGGKSLKIELYKLNVYGPGSFFKAHKDTPRADNMIASLVVVFPTRHEGGGLVLRHEDREFRFDSGKTISEAQVPSVAYAAFYGDVEHEVEPVVSGYRVTLTYNLYLTDSTAKDVQQGTAYELALKSAFRALLEDKKYLPEGGLLGFGLRHEYPVDLTEVKCSHSRDDKPKSQLTPIDQLLGALKGSDAILQKVCKDLGLKVDLQMLYHGQDGDILMCPGVPPFTDWEHEDYIAAWLTEEAQAKYIVQCYGQQPDLVIHWATRMRPLDVKKLCTPFVAYGNNAFMAKIYSTMCFIVEVGDAESRPTVI